MIHLHGDHVGARTRQLEGHCAGSGTDLYDELACAKLRFTYELFSPPGKKKVLTETAASLVPVGPPRRGHGEPPLHPCRFSIRSARGPQRLR